MCTTPYTDLSQQCQGDAVLVQNQQFSNKTKQQPLTVTFNGANVAHPYEHWAKSIKKYLKFPLNSVFLLQEYFRLYIPNRCWSSSCPRADRPAEGDGDNDDDDDDNDDDVDDDEDHDDNEDQDGEDDVELLIPCAGLLLGQEQIDQQEEFQGFAEGSPFLLNSHEAFLFVPFKSFQFSVVLFTIVYGIGSQGL